MDFAMLNNASLQVAGAQAQNASNALNAAKGNNKELHDKAMEFEAMFISQMLAPMFEGIEVDERFGGGHGEKMFRGMQINEMAKAIANSGGIGIADSVMKVMLQMQEA